MYLRCQHVPTLPFFRRRPRAVLPITDNLPPIIPSSPSIPSRTRLANMNMPDARMGANAPAENMDRGGFLTENNQRKEGGIPDFAERGFQEELVRCHDETNPAAGAERAAKAGGSANNGGDFGGNETERCDKKPALFSSTKRGTEEIILGNDGKHRAEVLSATTGPQIAEHVPPDHDGKICTEDNIVYCCKR